MSSPRLSSFILLAPLALAGGVYMLSPGPDVHSDPAHVHHEGGPDAAGMSDAAMSGRVAEYFRNHPRVSSPRDAVVLGIDATFTAGGTLFNADGSTATEIDTVHVPAGGTVRWTRANGVHTVTSGTGVADPEAGLVFNALLDAGHTSFEFTFAAVETVPFFCEPHEEFGMKGVVIVDGAVGVEPPAPRAMIGFTAAPWPNPSTAGASFRFELSAPARVRSDVVDVQGRHVAALTDGDFGAGDHVLTWNGRTSRGPAPAGVYYLRLRAPGFVGARTVTVRH